MDFPETEACRLLALNDGTIINQSPVAKKLCTMKSLQSSRLKIARDFLDGRGTVKARVSKDRTLSNRGGFPMENEPQIS